MRLSAPVALLAGLGTVSSLTITPKGVELNRVSRLTDSSCQRYSEGFYSTLKRSVTYHVNIYVSIIVDNSHCLCLFLNI